MDRKFDEEKIQAMQQENREQANEGNTFSRRKFIGASVLVAAGTALTSSAIPSFFDDSSSEAFVQKPLPYSFAALEPYIDARTMEIHYTKHHKGYINNLNKAVKGTDAEHMDITELLKNISSYNATVRNNAGGHYNHEFFWTVLSPEKTMLSPMLKHKIEQNFKTMEQFRKQLKEEALKVFGSGWIWLYVRPDKSVALGSTPNQDNPLMNVSAHRGVPIFGIDLWEHAYYLKHQNKRADYLDAVWEIIHWAEVDRRLDMALH